MLLCCLQQDDACCCSGVVEGRVGGGRSKRQGGVSATSRKPAPAAVARGVAAAGGAARLSRQQSASRRRPVHTSRQPIAADNGIIIITAADIDNHKSRPAHTHTCAPSEGPERGECHAVTTSFSPSASATSSAATPSTCDNRRHWCCCYKLPLQTHRHRLNCVVSRELCDVSPKAGSPHQAPGGGRRPRR